MKRKGNLYEKIISIKNLEAADIIAQQGKSKQRGVIKHNLRREENIKELHESLKNKTYHTTPYSIFTIHEPKERKIHRLDYFPNRIVHWAIVLQIADLLIKSFISQTYSCIEGRGIHKCLNDLNKALLDVEGTQYCLKLDIQKFYSSVDTTILKSKLRTKLKDNDLLWLLDEIIDSCRGGGQACQLATYYRNGLVIFI